MKHIRLRLFIVALLIAFLCSGTGVQAQSAVRQQLYKSFIAERMDQWGSLITDWEAITVMDTEAEQLELANYCYGYIGYLLGVKRLTDAEIYLDKGQKMVDLVLEKNPKCAEAYAYKGAFLAFKISTDHSIAAILGPTSVYYIHKAYKLDSLNLQAVIDQANFFFYAPGFFGGDVKKAIPLYAQAVALMESTGLWKENWRYFNLMILLAKANDKAGKTEEAKKVYNRLLTIEPEFGWVKNRLLPDLLKRAGR